MKTVVLECVGEEREIRLESGAAVVDGARLLFREVRRGGAPSRATREIWGDLMGWRGCRRTRW